MLTTILAFIFGVFTWTFMEYVIHRWLGHHPRFRPNFFSKEHIQHHSKGHYFATAKKKIVIASVAVKVMLPISWLVVGFQVGTAWVLGVGFMYLGYEWLHWRLHTHQGIGAYGRYLRKHHFYHHFVEPRMNHGVTSPIWDVVFGTYRTPQVIPVPAKLAMPWLVDQNEGWLLPRFHHHYQLIGQARS